ncbi:hypothetical protein J5N97_013566 [Dioscorea zingiberensis]|uniref:Uncharacterized protein n=1 Tax=Dioscorea zingiberensis TaxID=325984 RepID=A0A9D5HJ77_9LILI|nr:hypothetical protein J5N97_013566 [Dioscorea zingiberensis]
MISRLESSRRHRLMDPMLDAPSPKTVSKFESNSGRAQKNRAMEMSSKMSIIRFKEVIQASKRVSSFLLP